MENASEERELVRGYIDGCFDIMHSGHYNAIRQAKNVCDVLVVGVHSDKEIEENKALPVMQEPERYALLEHIKWIDEIVHDVPYSPQLATLELARAKFCIHGDDMPVNAQGVCAYDEMRIAGRLRIVKRTEGVSTTDIIGRLLTLARPQQASPEVSPMGEKVNPDEAIEQMSPPSACSRAPVAPAPEAAAELLAMVDRLASKYSMDALDIERLRTAIDSCATVPQSGGGLLMSPAPPPSPRSCRSASEQQSVRTRVPVQLLASTRRITEFASSRQPGKDDLVVYVAGSFDMFHVGHAQFLKDAKALGSFLLVGIHDDRSVSRSKGSNLPIMNLNERVLNVCACKWVDEVIIGAPLDITEDLVKTWSISKVARATGHARNATADQAQADPYLAAKRLGMYCEVPSQWPHLCHEAIVQRVIRNRESYLRRNNDRARREDVYYEAKDANAAPVEA